MAYKILREKLLGLAGFPQITRGKAFFFPLISTYLRAFFFGLLGALFPGPWNNTFSVHISSLTKVGSPILFLRNKKSSAMPVVEHEHSALPCAICQVGVMIMSELGFEEIMKIAEKNENVNQEFAHETYGPHGPTTFKPNHTHAIAV